MYSTEQALVIKHIDHGPFVSYLVAGYIILAFSMLFFRELDWLALIPATGAYCMAATSEDKMQAIIIVGMLVVKQLLFEQGLLKYLLPFTNK